MNALDDVLKHIPRAYQEELFLRAQRSNVIAAADTGSGKTFIAALLIKWICFVVVRRRDDRGRVSRILWQLSRMQDTSLSSSNVESARNLARLMSVYSHEQSDSPKYKN